MWCLLDKCLPSHVLLALFDGLPIALPYNHASALVASHLDTLDGQRVDMKHVMAESNPKMVNGGRIQKMEGLSEMHARTGDDVNPVKAN